MKHIQRTVKHRAVSPLVQALLFAADLGSGGLSAYPAHEQGGPNTSRMIAAERLFV